MGALFDSLVAFFKEDDWKFTPHPDKAIVHLGFSGDNGRWDCIGRVREDVGQIIFYSIASFKAQEPVRAAVAEFITRANYGLPFGNFEMDFGDGEIRVKTALNVKEGRPAPGQIKIMVYSNISLMDRYLPGLMAVCYGGASPAEAVSKIEGE